jgi:hypothetical protein
MTRLVRLTALFALLAPLCLAAGCKQGAGDRCQVQSDCDSGLLCILPAGGTPQAGGTCQVPGSGAADMQAATPADMASTDLAGTAPADLAHAATD